MGYGLIQHWNGAHWNLVPSAPGGNPADLRGVTTVASNDVWAVGRRQETASPYYQKTLVENWDGSAWTVVPSPNGSALTAQLLGVDAVSANDIWAVGDSSAPAPTHVQTLIEHWDGSSWNVIPSPCVSGSSWNALTSVAVVSASDVWAVGYYMESNWRTLTMHWEGSTWSIVPSPNPGDGNNYYGTITNELYGVAAVSTSDVWAVGVYGKSDGLNVTNQTLIERYTVP